MKKTIVLLVVCALAIVSNAKTTWDLLDGYSFEMYVAEYKKVYTTEEEYHRREKIFNDNLAVVLKHNSEPFHTYKQGVNHLSDRTTEEFRKLLGYKSEGSSHKKRATAVHPTYISAVEELPTSVDWRTKGVVTPVKDQGQCGSCWSFGTAETIESHYALSGQPLTVLSEQQILDCVPNTNDCGGQGGCQGGTPEIAYEKLIAMGGLASEWQYPYVSYFGTDYQCHFNATVTKPVAVLKDYVVLDSNNYTSVLNALATIGPLAINVDAAAWQGYEVGVFSGCNANTTDIDHVVQLVGYGTDTINGDYWLVRNSWTPLWGESGYIRLARQPALCGIDTNPQDGTGCNGGPATVEVCGPCGLLYDVSYPVIV
eukprot:TRINITY_DN1412_c0_g1_i1.p1 TRINITY_DN1412_c0_g1~~TRINITY_DN1412_c0_g1_i1.p1  ORF type:complete len:376 (-),score=95.92 TRINITY_DN1412_c0_g1_i1:35-1141(-)